MITECVICGREFQARRSTAKYCSNRCRLMAQRGVAYSGELKPPDVRIKMSDDEALAVIARAKEAADDLSRASMHTSAPLCLALKRISRRLLDAIAREGL